MSPSPHVRRSARIAVVIALGFIAAGRAHAQNCVGCTPLDDLAGPPYLGTYPLGLYPGGTNTPPAPQLSLALAAAANVVARDASGNSDPNGWIGLLAIGMSNTNQEFAVFERNEDFNMVHNGRVIIVDGAVGGQSADVIVNPSASYWNTVAARIAAAGLDPDQIQVVWIKEAEGGLANPTFPAHAETLATHIRGIVRDMKDRFPQLQICYLASRVYGGYTTSTHLGEPVSYEAAFAYRNLIDDQMSGDPALNADPNAGPVEAPVLLWGPYLWANGTVPRASDGLTWLQSDFEPDNVHPSASGEARVAGLLTAFFASDATATPWYAPDGASYLDVIDAVADAYIDAAQPVTNFGALSALQWTYSAIRSYVRFDLSAVTDSVVHAKLSMKTPPDQTIRAGEVVVVSNTTWNELTINASNAPAFDGAVLGIIPSASRGTAVSLDVTAAVQAAIAANPGSAALSLGVRARPGAAVPENVGSRESIDPPRLVLTMVSRPTAAGGRASGVPRLRITSAPNPTGGRTRIVVEMETAGHLVVEVLDVRGRRVRALADRMMEPGTHELVWNGRRTDARRVPAGVYFVRAAVAGVPGETASHKIIVVH